MNDTCYLIAEQKRMLEVTFVPLTPIYWVLVSYRLQLHMKSATCLCMVNSKKDKRATADSSHLAVHLAALAACRSHEGL